jgi:HD-GYP domain-containing protein (c-di-GMP phosphodiesterase class II)
VDDSLREIKKAAGSQLDPSLVKIFVDTVNDTKSSYQH